MAKKASKKYVKICSSIRYLYAKPDGSSERVAKSSKGDLLEYITKRTVDEKVWYQVKYEDKKLWIKAVGIKFVKDDED